MNRDNNLNSLIDSSRQYKTRTQPFYCDDDVFAMDMQKVITRKWMLVDHCSRIPDAGQYFVFETGHESIIVIRDTDLTINAFFNVCRHRGSVICLDKQGKSKRLTCPYHGWSYGLDGSLKAARFMPEGFDPLEHGLFKCHIKVHHGLIFLNLCEGEAPDFEQEFAVFEPHLKFHGFENAKIAHQQSYPTDANWKLVVENFLECYHCASAHPEFCSRHPREALIAIGAGPSSGPAAEVEKFAPVLDTWEQQAGKLGRPIGAVDDDELSTHMKFLLQRPHKNDIKSETEDGQPVACLMGERSEFDLGRMHLSFSPLNHIIAGNDFAAMIVFSPREAMKTDVEISWLVDGKADNVDVERMIWMWDVTTRQDKIITENNQRGITSSRYQPGPLSDQELRVKTFSRWYANQLSS